MSGSSSEYQRPSGTPPPSAQTERIVKAIPYDPTSLTLTLNPWPTGIEFPALPLGAVGKDVKTPPITFGPKQTATWNKEQIVMGEDGHGVQIGAVWHDMATEGAVISSDQAPPKATHTEDQADSVSPSTEPTNPVITSSDESPTSASSPTASTNSGPSTLTAVPGTKGLSGGAVAGVAIGCLLAGALIAGFIVWFCLKRRKPAGGVRDSEASTVALMHREKGPVAKTVSVSSGSPIASALESGLPQPLEDKVISGEISKISNLIKNHVQSYYHTRAVSAGIIDHDDLQALGKNLPVSLGTLSTLLHNSATREIALRFCLAWVVTSRIQLYCLPDTSFLPPEISLPLHSIANADQSSQFHAPLFTKWRALTAELLKSTYVRIPFTVRDGRVHNIQVAATELDNVLRPFADSRMDDGARSRNLEEILKRSAQFAFILFSQSTTWDFDWKNEEGTKPGSLCIFPALVQVADENGEPINPPRPFSEAVNRRLDE